MSDTQSLYAELKADLQALATPLFEASEMFVRKYGAFLPHGAVLANDDQVRLVMAAPDGFEERDVSLVEVLPELHEALLEAAKDGVKAVAVAEDVRITPEDGKETAAMKVLVEHQRGLRVAYYVPYAKKLLRQYKFGAMSGRPCEAEVRAWSK